MGYFFPKTVKALNRSLLGHLIMSLSLIKLMFILMTYSSDVKADMTGVSKIQPVQLILSGPCRQQQLQLASPRVAAWTLACADTVGDLGWKQPPLPTWLPGAIQGYGR